MKNFFAKIILSQAFQLSILGSCLRWIIQKLSGKVNFSPFFLLDSQAIERPHYAYCMIAAADLAKRLGLNHISAIEFGVAGGNGLKFMCDFAKQIKQHTGVSIDCYGFDTGKGMPSPVDEYDLPYWFQEKQYIMDEELLRKTVPDGKLVIGEIKDTIESFIDTYKPAPIGVIFNDVDYKSSTKDSFYLFKHIIKKSEHFLPRIFMYFDDVIGRQYEMYGSFNGQLAAISEFNHEQDNVKIHLNQNLLPKIHLSYRHNIYYAHLFNHPKYQNYIGGKNQKSLMEGLRLS